MTKKFRRTKDLQRAGKCTSLASRQCEVIELVKQRMDAAYRLMNLYAQDPYNMGATDKDGKPFNRQSRTEPQAILGEVYFILAPASQALQKFTDSSEFEVLREAVLGALEDEHTLYMSKLASDISKRRKEAEANLRLLETASRNKIATKLRHARRERDKLNNEIHQINMSSQSLIDKLNEQVRVREAEVASYLGETQRNAPHRHRAGKREIEL